MSNNELADIVYKILLNGPGTYTSESLDMLQSLSRTNKHKIYDEVHEVVDDGTGIKIPLIYILAASLKLEEIILQDGTDEDIDTTWKLVWEQLISEKRVREIPDNIRNRFKVIE